MMVRIIRLVASCFCVLFVTAAASADTVQIGASDQGWVAETGETNTNQNYFAGRSSFLGRNWFAFDLAGVSGDITSASLSALLEGTYGSQGTGDYELRASAVSLNDLVNRVGGSTIFDQMDDGALLGSISLHPSLNGTVITIEFNSAGLAVLEAGMGGEIALSGNILNDLQLMPVTGLFGASGFYPQFIPSLNIKFTPFGAVVPLPGAAGLGLAGLLGAGALRRRR